MRVRASRTDLFIDCASSILESAAPHNPTHEAARLGDAVHDSLPARIIDGDVNLTEIADRHSVKVADLAPLHTFGLKTWRDVLRAQMPDPKAEVSLKSDLISGHVDLLHHDGDSAVITDWKSGWLRRHKHFQMASYAHGARAEFGMPKSGQITTVLVWLRYGEIDVANYDDARLDQFAEAMKAQLKEIGRHYAAGEWCAYCPRRLECDTRHAYVQSAARSLSPLNKAELTPEKLVALWPQSRMLKKAIEEYESVLREQLSHGDLSGPDGISLCLAEIKKHAIDPRKAWSVLMWECGFTQDDMARVLTVNKSAVETIAMEKAEHGMKGKAKVQTIDALKEAGAVTISSYRKIEVKR